MGSCLQTWHGVRRAAGRCAVSSCHGRAQGRVVPSEMGARVAGSPSSEVLRTAGLRHGGLRFWAWRGGWVGCGFLVVLLGPLWFWGQGGALGLDSLIWAVLFELCGSVGAGGGWSR